MITSNIWGAALSVLSISWCCAGAAKPDANASDANPATPPPDATVGTAGSTSAGSAGNTQEEEKVQIQLTVDGRALTATLANNAAARDFVALLPLELTLRDYASTEKVSDLPTRLSTEGAPAGIDPAVGDITYYAPWGNLAIFYRDFGYANGLVKLGRIDTGVETLGSQRGDFTVRIERAGQ